ncbi:MAG: chemotaxis protein CheD [Planctomycetota bacterium]|nr:MAG: chemotaxis protein CheD [Planctomycetota bacterium]
MAVTSAQKRDTTADASTGTVYSIGIAEMRVVRAPDRVRTVLGSCIGIALYDTGRQLGGLAHVILPSSAEGQGDPGKFADSAIDLLVEQLLAEGARKIKLRAKIAGGAAMFGDEHAASLGARNAAAVQEHLARHSIPLVASAVGGTKGRRVLLNPADGCIEVAIIGEQVQIL